MGMRKEVYEALGGFSDMRYGEDIDFSIRIFAAGYKCRYFPGAWVYHKRRTNFVQFFRQVWHSGYARIILYQKYPESLKWVHCLPALFVVGLLGVCISAFFVPMVWGLLLFYISLIFFVGRMSGYGEVQIGQVIGFVTYISFILTATLMASMIFIMLPRAEVSVTRIEEILNSESEIQDREDALLPEQIRGEICIEQET